MGNKTVDTTYWGNEEKSMTVPVGWEDHQWTQQLVRKYLRDDSLELSISKYRNGINDTGGEATIWISQEEFDFLSPNGFILECCQDVVIAKTSAGYCIQKYFGRQKNESDLPCRSLRASQSGFKRSHIYGLECVIRIK